MLAILPDMLLFTAASVAQPYGPLIVHCDSITTGLDGSAVTLAANRVAETRAHDKMTDGSLLTRSWHSTPFHSKGLFRQDSMGILSLPPEQAGI